MCYDVNPPIHGAARGDCVSAGAGQICRFECEPTYGLVGPSSISCLTSGWTASPPICTAIICSNQTAPADGTLVGDCSPGRGGSSCTLVCAAGLRPMGNMTITCLPSGVWNLPLGTCVPIACEARPVTIPNGRATGACSPGRALQSCVYECTAGYAVTAGSSVLFCGLNAMWVGVVPTCSRILCRSIPAVPGLLNTMGECASSVSSVMYK